MGEGLSVTQSCPARCDPMDCSPSGPSAHSILQARILEWDAVSFSVGREWIHVRTAESLCCPPETMMPTKVRLVKAVVFPVCMDMRAGP